MSDQPNAKAKTEHEQPTDFDEKGFPVFERTPEQIRMSMIKGGCRRTVIEAANRYMKSRDRAELEKIQQIVDELDDAFVLVVPQKDGIPYSITFNPHTPTPEDVPPLDGTKNGEVV